MSPATMSPTVIDPDLSLADMALTAHPILGLARFARVAFMGGDTSALVADLEARIAADASDAGAFMDLSILRQLRGEKEEGLRLQGVALRLCRLYRVLDEPVEGGSAPLRLLALVSPGDFLANTPIDFMVQQQNVDLDLLFIAPGESLPGVIPDHDLLLVAIGYNETNAPLLTALVPVIESWPRPALNRPADILATSREGVAERLEGTAGVLVPAIAKVSREDVAALAQGATQLDMLMPGASYPIIIRPLGSHAGTGLEKIDAADALLPYLAAQEADGFHIAQFIDYRGADGYFRKARIAVFGGTAYLAHLAISERWMIHYLNAGMLDNPLKRALEADAMAGFDEEFAVRHGAALRQIASRLALDYFLIDCGEAPDGRLLIFEADNAMVIHDMDDATIYPYKVPQMKKIFSAFRAFLETRSAQAM